MDIAWWRHQMEIFSALLAICAGNSPVPGEFSAQRPVTRSFDVFVDLRPNKRLSKQSWGWWSETPSSSLWRHRNVWYDGHHGYHTIALVSAKQCPNSNKVPWKENPYFVSENAICKILVLFSGFDLSENIFRYSSPVPICHTCQQQIAESCQYYDMHMWLYYISGSASHLIYHDDVMKWKHFPRYWPFVRGIHRSPVNSPHKGQWRGALMFSLVCVWINGWVNNREGSDLRRHRTHYDVTVMCWLMTHTQLAVPTTLSISYQHPNNQGFQSVHLWHGDRALISRSCWRQIITKTLSGEFSGHRCSPLTNGRWSGALTFPLFLIWTICDAVVMHVPVAHFI